MFVSFLSTPSAFSFFFFFFNDTATTEIYTLSLHDALPICGNTSDSDLIECINYATSKRANIINASWGGGPFSERSEEHTSELQSLAYLVCRLLLEKKKISNATNGIPASTIP